MNVPAITAADVVVAAAAATALGVLGRLLLRLIKTIEALWQLADRELTHNHGSSMKDDLHGLAVAAGVLARKVDELARAQEADRKRLDNALRLAAEHHPDDAWRYRK